MERFYREMRREHGVLLADGEPVGGKWNYDAQNREQFGRTGPGDIPRPRAFAPDERTRDVLGLVEARFADHPGGLSRFDWAVTREQAQEALADFCALRLAQFGPYQDAMWAGEPYLYHSRLSSALNLKLLDPREVIEAAEGAYSRGEAPLHSVEGLIRQILGWREYVRGIYWQRMPEYATRNGLEAELSLPRFYWTGETDMQCLRECLGQTLAYGYAHHIQRLMVTGLYALLLGVQPVEVHEWYLAVYVDAVEWVELPNTLGMSQYADGGIMATKPYCASGKYMQRMSNYCGDCRYDPARRLGTDACPYTTLYWDFLMRNRDRLRGNPRMGLQYHNLDRIDRDEQRAIRRQAEHVRSEATAR
jgi:deoxyribodipyrimidine photolyase-related protein